MSHRAISSGVGAHPTPYVGVCASAVEPRMMDASRSGRHVRLCTSVFQGAVSLQCPALNGIVVVDRIETPAQRRVYPSRAGRSPCRQCTGTAGCTRCRPMSSRAEISCAQSEARATEDRHLATWFHRRSIPRPVGRIPVLTRRFHSARRTPAHRAVVRAPAAVINDLGSIVKVNMRAWPSASRSVYLDVSSRVMYGWSTTLRRRSHFTLILPSQPGTNSRSGYPCSGRSDSPFWP